MGGLPLARREPEASPRASSKAASAALLALPGCAEPAAELPGSGAERNARSS